MKILGIDTSCDDTCIALLEIKNSHFKILSNIVSSQVKLHTKYGGVYPFLAKREHQKNLPLVFKKVIKDPSEIDLIGVTVGPGLEPCLWQGINFAQDLAKKFKKSLIPINHIEAHILINWLKSKDMLMPAVCLVVSGGHTQLILMKAFKNYKIIGETRDDAAGECFDKVARILGLGYPGGPIISQFAAKIRDKKLNIFLPRPMIYQKNYDFSFSGLKTAVLYNYRNQNSKIRKSQIYIEEMSFEVQQAIIDVLIYKTLKAAQKCRAKTIILGGGVIANKQLRKQFQEKIKKEIPNIKYQLPGIRFCTDNAAMVALTSYFYRSKTKKPENIKAEANLSI